MICDLVVLSGAGAKVSFRFAFFGVVVKRIARPRRPVHAAPSSGQRRARAAAASRGANGAPARAVRARLKGCCAVVLFCLSVVLSRFARALRGIVWAHVIDGL
jgi:hypothetical protein